MTRIGTAYFYSSATAAMDQNQTALSQTQAQLSSGLKYNTPADNPGAAANVLSLQTSQSLITQYQSNVSTASGQLSAMGNTLGSITSTVQSIRALVVQAGDGTLTQANRQAIAIQINQQMGALAGLMNSKNVLGQYMFGGYQTSTPPYAIGANGQYAYQGDEGQNSVAVTNNSQIMTTLPGQGIFDAIPSVNKTLLTSSSSLNTSQPPATINGGSITDQTAFNSNYPSDYKIVFNPTSQSTPPGLQNYSVLNAQTGHPVLQNITYSSGTSINFNGLSVAVSGSPQVGDTFFVDSSPNQSLLTTVQNAVNGLTTLSNSAADQSNLTTLISNTLGNIDNAISSISDAQAQVGAAQNVVSQAQSTNSSVSLSVTQSLSSLTAVDYAQASTQLSMQQTILQASQQSFVKISGLSLFNYLGTTGG